MNKYFDFVSSMKQNKSNFIIWTVLLMTLSLNINKKFLTFRHNKKVK